MEEPDRGQGKVVIEQTNGKQEKTVAVEVYILDQGIYLGLKQFCSIHVNVKFKRITLCTHWYQLSHAGASSLLCLLPGKSSSLAGLSHTGNEAAPCPPLPSTWNPSPLYQLHYCPGDYMGRRLLPSWTSCSAWNQDNRGKKV